MGDTVSAETNLLRTLAMSTTAFGVVLGLGALGAAAGALLAPGIARRIGPGPMMLAALGITPVTQIPLLLASSGLGWQIVIGGALIVQLACAGAAGTTQRSIRQIITASRMQARMQAVSTWLTAGARPVGALLAGALGTWARANRATLGRALAAAGMVPYRTEWWHWSFGDRYWALQTQRRAAPVRTCRTALTPTNLPFTNEERSVAITRTDWSERYTEGRGFRRLGDDEKGLLVEHAPAPEGGRALDVGCGTGEMSVYLASLGYTVDGADFAEGALEQARTHHPDAEVRWLCLDIERDDPAPLGNDLYDLVVFRLSVAFLNDRTRVLHALGRRLREGGTMLVITPLAAHTPAEKRRIALDEDEITALTCGWTSVQRLAAGDLAALVLRGPCADTVAVERSVPATGYAVAGALAVVTDDHGRVLLGWSKRGMWEAPGGKIDGAEPLDGAGVRELAEETGLHATGASVVSILTDAAQGVPRVTAVIRITGFTGTLTTAEPQKFTRWEWHDPHGLGCLGPVFTPAANALDAVWPGVIPGLPPVNAYPTAAELTPVPGEPAEAVRLRHRMADAVIAGGWTSSAVVQEALRTVPRHRFAPETDLKTVYDDDLAVVTRRDEHGRATSSVSAAWLQADMAEQLQLTPGAAVLEVGSGGYNAELLAHVVGPAGRVVTVDVDPYVVHRTQRLCAEAGSGQVTLGSASA